MRMMSFALTKSKRQETPVLKRSPAYLAALIEAETPKPDGFKATFSACKFFGTHSDECNVFEAAEHHGWNTGWAAAASIGESTMAAQARRIEALEAALREITHERSARRWLRAFDKAKALLRKEEKL